MPAALPFPPVEMRVLVGPTDEASFDNPTGAPVYPDLPDSASEAILDFGCGCGRLARQLLQQERPAIGQYLGVDLHRGMVRWCTENLAPHHPRFRFEHSDTYAAGLNPQGTARFHPLPAESATYTLAIAHSVFTHILQEEIPAYLGELARVLRRDGILRSSWFLFDREAFPMLQEFQHALYINHVDASNAVIVDRAWLPIVARQQGLAIVGAVPPTLRGYHWLLDLAPIASGRPALVELPEDTAPIGAHPPPLMPVAADEIGMAG